MPDYLHHQTCPTIHQRRISSQPLVACEDDTFNFVLLLTIDPSYFTTYRQTMMFRLSPCIHIFVFLFPFKRCFRYAFTPIFSDHVVAKYTLGQFPSIYGFMLPHSNKWGRAYSLLKYQYFSMHLIHQQALVLLLKAYQVYQKLRLRILRNQFLRHSRT